MKQRGLALLLTWSCDHADRSDWLTNPKGATGSPESGGKGVATGMLVVDCWSGMHGDFRNWVTSFTPACGSGSVEVFTPARLEKWWGPKP